MRWLVLLYTESSPIGPTVGLDSAYNGTTAAHMKAAHMQAAHMKAAHMKAAHTMGPTQHAMGQNT